MSEELFTTPEPSFLFVKNRAAAKSLLDQVNADYGYPNPATKTDRAVDPIPHPTEEWCLISLDIMEIFAPKNKGHLRIKEQVQARVSTKEFEMVATKTAIVSTVEVVPKDGGVVSKGEVVPSVPKGEGVPDGGAIPKGEVVLEELFCRITETIAKELGFFGDQVVGEKADQAGPGPVLEN